MSKIVWVLFLSAAVLSLETFPNALAGVRTSGLSAHGSPTRLDWIDKVRRGEFDSLTRRLEDLQSRHERGEVGWLVVKRAFDVFRYSDPELVKHFNAWVEAHPLSFASHTARGIYVANLGYTFRGSRFADKTDARALGLMGHFLAKAMEDLQVGSRLNERAFMPNAEIMQLYMWAGPHQFLADLYQKTKNRVPDASLLHLYYANALRPIWRTARTREEYQGHIQELMKFVAEAAERSATEPEFRIIGRFVRDLAGMKKLDRRDHGGAYEIYSSLIKEFDRPIFRRNRARALAGMGRYDEAFDDLRKGIELDPNDDETHLALARMLKDRKRLTEAEKYINKGLELDPQDPEKLMERVSIRWHQGRWKEIEDDLKEAEVFAAWDSRVHAMRGRMYINLRLDNKAKAAFKRAFELSPSDPRIFGEYISALIRDQDCETFYLLPKFLEVCGTSRYCQRERLSIIKSNIKGLRLEKACGRKAPWNGTAKSDDGTY